jgi:hypothetical protein
MKLGGHVTAIFEAATLKTTFDKAKLRALGRGGALVRKIARRKLVRRNRNAQPGESPTDRTGKVKRFLLYHLDKPTYVTTIGVKSLGTEQTAGALEHGGWWTIRTPKGRRRAFYRKFPFLSPALNEAMPYLPGLFADLVASH